MKNIKINDTSTSYFIDEQGRLFNQKTQRYYKGTIRGGYRYFDLRWGGKKYSYTQHRLVAEYFIDNPKGFPIVHHRDHNRLNNTIDNLEWVDFSQNNISENKTPNQKDHSDLNNYENEEEQWQNFRDTYYSISSLGRVRNNKLNRILQGKINDVGYREVCLRINKIKKTFLLHRLVWEVFRETPCVINHIDGNKMNNRLANLENVSYQENSLKAIYETQTHCFPKTAQLDEEGNIIQVFQNNADAARQMGVRPQSIQAAISKGSKSCGFYWKNLK